MSGDGRAALRQPVEAGLAAHEDAEVLIGGYQDGSGSGASVLHQAAQEAGGLGGGFDGDEVGGDV